MASWMHRMALFSLGCFGQWFSNFGVFVVSCCMKLESSSVILSHPEAILEPYWGGPSWACLGPAWGYAGPVFDLQFFKMRLGGGLNSAC